MDMTYPERVVGNGEIESQKRFYEMLAEQLIDNTYDTTARRSSPRSGRSSSPANSEQARAPINPLDGTPRMGIGPHVTPTKRKRKRKDGTETKKALQGE